MLRRLLLLIFTAPAAVGVVIFALGVAPAGALGILAAMLRIYAVLWLLLAIGWGLRHVLRWFFWRVSRRLAFSYFLIGVVPIPLVAVLVAVALYVLAGFFLGHLYRQAADSLQRDVELAARAQLAEFLVSGDTRQQDEELGVSFAYYRSGERIAGERRAPEVWPLDAASGPAIGRSLSDGPPPASSEPSADSAPAADRARPTPARAQRDGTSDRIDPAAGLAPTEILSAAESTVAGELQLFFAGRDDVVSFDPILGGFAARGEWGVAAIFDRPLGTELSRRSGVWSEPKIASDRLDLNVAIEIGDRRMSFDQLEPEAPPEAIRAFFGVSERPSWIDRPFVGWLEIGDEVRSLDGRETGVATAVLVATPRAVVDLLTPQATDAGALGYVTFGVVALLLFDIYLIALVMALFMIFGLSQAVNRLSVAAEKVKEGDFSARIEVRRRDQVGALQRNFNEMAANLEELIADAAQKEIWERELALARELQQSLLPDAVRAPRPLRAATYFRPSTAIGGDYFDLLHLADGRLAVAVADVSGHGLSAGLRMAMVKSALEVLCGEENEPATVLARLHLLLKERLLRVDGGRRDRRAFVTATLTAVDPASGQVEIANAGHPPTYLLRSGQVQEIEMPSPPLGTLGHRFPSRRLALEPNDVLLWLSDGLIEAVDRRGEVFGFQRVRATLEAAQLGGPPSPEEAKRALLEAVVSHTADGGSLDDDLTVVVLSWDGHGATPDAD